MGGSFSGYIKTGGRLSVSEIINHELLQAKVRLSKNTKINQTVWGLLQRYSDWDCENVSVKDRSKSPLFWKEQDSKWRLSYNLETQLDDIHKLIESYKKLPLNKTQNKTIKGFEFVTFHQSFSYEDFMEGIKPVILKNKNIQEINDPEEINIQNKNLEYDIEDGIFKKICERARDNKPHRFAIFIDEINRGNIASIFGELITLIEIDKREKQQTRLPYSKSLFTVPDNLDIYGTMNTADRSVEALDSALRRRFEFREMPPDYNVLKNKTKKIEGIDLSDLLKKINSRIEKLLDKDHMIGHSYFLKINAPEDLKNTFKNQIIPLLQEYFFGDYAKIGLILGNEFFKNDPSTEVKFANFKDYDSSLFDDKEVHHLIDLSTMEIGVFMEAIKNLLK